MFPPYDLRSVPQENLIPLTSNATGSSSRQVSDSFVTPCGHTQVGISPSCIHNVFFMFFKCQFQFQVLDH